MVKRITYLTRRPDLTPAQFRGHWSTIHADIARDLPGVVAYRQNHVVHYEEDVDARLFDVDGIVELWFENGTAAEAGFGPTWPIASSSMSASSCRGSRVLLSPGQTQALSDAVSSGCSGHMSSANVQPSKQPSTGLRAEFWRTSCTSTGSKSVRLCFLGLVCGANRCRWSLHPWDSTASKPRGVRRAWPAERSDPLDVLSGPWQRRFRSSNRRHFAPEVDGWHLVDVTGHSWRRCARE